MTLSISINLSFKLNVILKIVKSLKILSSTISKWPHSRHTQKTISTRSFRIIKCFFICLLLSPLKNFHSVCVLLLNKLSWYGCGEFFVNSLVLKVFFILFFINRKVSGYLPPTKIWHVVIGKFFDIG